MFKVPVAVSGRPIAIAGKDPAYKATGVLDPKFEINDTTDPDHDDVPDIVDNCPNKANARQVVGGLLIQPDFDRDGVGDACDNCPNVFNPIPAGKPTQDDTDLDGLGDVCDSCPAVTNTGSCCDPTCVAPPGAPAGWLACANSAEVGAVCTMQNEPDDDNDGLPNACDNCPSNTNAFPCVTDKNCANLYSTPSLFLSNLHGSLPVLCARSSFSLGQFNAGHIAELGVCTVQADRDSDGRGDICDNCQTKPNWSYPGVAVGLGPNVVLPAMYSQVDSDDNGLGDACDRCSGPPAQSPDQFLAALAANGNVLPPGDIKACTSDADCPKAGSTWAKTAPSVQNFCQIVVDGLAVPGDPGHTYKTVCAAQPDQDEDSSPDACDNCVDVTNYAQANCNRDMEIKYNLPYPYRGDVCDPVPCINVSQTDVVDVGAPAGDPHKVMTLAFTPNVLSHSRPHGWAPGIPSQVRSKVRMCLKPKVQDCPKDSALLDMAPWNATTQVVDPSNPIIVGAGTLTFTGPVDPSSNAYATQLGGPFLPAMDASQTTWWDYAADVTSQYPPPYFVTHVDSVEMYGVGVKSLQLVSDTGFSTPGTGQKFDKLSNYFNALNVPAPPGSNPFVTPGLVPCYKPPPPQPTHACQIVLSSGDVGPPQQVGDGTGAGTSCGLSAKYGCPVWSASGALIAASLSSGTVEALTPNGAIDLTSEISPATLTSLLTPDAQWLTPVEPAALRHRGLPTLVGLDATGAVVVDALGIDATGHLASRMRRTPRTDAAVSTLTPVGPAVALGMAYSLNEQRVFVVGGIAQDGALAGSAHELDVVSGASRQLPISGPIPKVVLAMTYRAVDNALYVIEEVAKKGALRERLVRIALDSMRADVVGSWPRTKHTDRYQLGIANDGSLLLFASSSKLQSYVGGVIMLPAPTGHEDDSDLGEGDHELRLVGVVKGKGEIMSPPVATPGGVAVSTYMKAAGVRAALLSGTAVPNATGTKQRCQEAFP